MGAAAVAGLPGRAVIFRNGPKLALSPGEC